MEEKPSVEVIQGPLRADISFNGRLLYSSSAAPEKRASGLPRASETLYIVISPLLFHGTDLLASIIPDDSFVICIEREPEIFSITSDYHKASPLKDSDYFLADSAAASRISEFITRHRCRKIIPVKLNRGYMINRKYYDLMLQKAGTFLSGFWKNRMTTIHMGRLWCRNIFLNCPRIEGASFISSLKTEKPVISLGAGESLEGSIDFLKANRDKFFLTAADTAVTSLLLNGIKPDLVIALESQHANLYDFYENESFDLPVAADLTSSPELLRKLRGPLYFYISEFDYSIIFELLESSGLLPPVLPPLGSVGITAMLISLMLTDNWVIFSGLDFSFIPDKYHASGSPSHIISQCSEDRMSKAGFFQTAFNGKRNKETDKSGRLVYTDIIMKSYSDTLSSIILKSGRIIDIGRNGLSNPAPLFSEDKLMEILSSEPPEDDQELLREYKSVSSRPDASLCGSSRRFLEAEAAKLAKATAEVINFQNTRTERGVLPESSINMLKQLDYTWLFFPDRCPLPSSDSSFLRRFLFSAAWFSDQISHAVSETNRQS